MTENPLADRSALPVILDEVLDPTHHDLLQLVCDGLLDPSAIDVNHPGFGNALLDGMGLRGAHEAAVRATGTIHTCPPWCVAEHPRIAIYEADADPCHEGGEAVAGDATVAVSAVGTAPANIYLIGDVGDLTGSQARVLAAALLNASDELDGIALADPADWRDDPDVDG